MKKESNNFGLLTGVGHYQDNEKTQLPAAGIDLRIMKDALTEGLKFHSDNIRMLGDKDGIVSTHSFARALAEFEGLIGTEDTFVFYFSGHGTQEGLCFSDGTVDLQSIINYVERLRAGRKIVIIDCCFSGLAQIQGISGHTFEEMISSFVGRGIAVMASSAPDEQSWLMGNGGASLYTTVVSTAVRSRRLIRQGRIALSGIIDEVRCLMQEWNRMNPKLQQHPIYRENYIGDITFQVEEYHPYITQKISAETEAYILHSIKPLSTGKLKRFAAFVILKDPDDSLLPKITLEIVSQFRNSDVYSSRESELRFKGRSADAIWCYFGRDTEDIERSNHFAYTIWAGSDKLKRQYYRENRNSEVTDGIYIFWNTSYGLVKEIQKTTTPEEEIIARYQELAGLLIMKAESFIKEYEEMENGVISPRKLRQNNAEWIRDIKRLYFLLTEADPVPVGKTRWAEAVLELAGWATDMAIWLEQIGFADLPGEQWMIKSSIDRYRRSLEQLQTIENS